MIATGNSQAVADLAESFDLAVEEKGAQV